MASSDAHQNARFVCDLEASIEVGGRPPVLGLAKDINTAGVCVLTEIPVPAGKEISIHLRLVFDDATSDTLVVPARTLWLTRTEGHFQIGAAFAQLPVDLWQRLDVLLRCLIGEIAFGQRT